MSVKIRIPSYIQQYTNQMEVVEVNGSTIGECLQDMFRQLPDLEKTVPSTGFEIYINGERIFSWESDKPVKTGEELLISFLTGCC